MEAWLVAFAWTFGLELPVFVLWLRSKIGLGRSILMALVLNLVTHPTMFFGLLGHEIADAYVLAGVLVVAVESALLLVLLGLLVAPGERPSVLTSLLATIMANAVTVAASEGLQGLEFI